MPKLWSETIEGHRRSVRDATLDTAAMLVAHHGLAAVTMSRIAQETGIGRATLYKYFPNVEAIVHAWHERQVARHLEHLANVRDTAGEDPAKRLTAVLDAYADIQHERAGHHGQHHGVELAALVHTGPETADARAHLRDMIRDLLHAATHAGSVRADIPPTELADFCLHALDAATHAPSRSAVRRLVAVTTAGLRPSS
ncbi:TetR/AcrR family transcriptional regulator [Actinokineospora sp. HUAS TT18]|uniref:TetR/AcrR family transcriptional regulator n=1 Tax=Actinokineospora sp. HUAS TT18 TaxID=3447451 RepID=UPI003F525DE4